MFESPTFGQVTSHRGSRTVRCSLYLCALHYWVYTLQKAARITSGGMRLLLQVIKEPLIFLFKQHPRCSRLLLQYMDREEGGMPFRTYRSDPKGHCGCSSLKTTARQAWFYGFTVFHRLQHHLKCASTSMILQAMLLVCVCVIAMRGGWWAFTRQHKHCIRFLLCTEANLNIVRSYFIWKQIISSVGSND
jgi:hypothetical protein